MTAAAAVPTRADMVPGIRIKDVHVGERARRDYGDLEPLKASILEHGLLQPIVLLPDDYLLCGGRRLEACKQLGWESIPFVRSLSQTDAIARIKAERDENTCRKDMTPSELVAIGRKLEELKRPEAETRQAAGRVLGGQVRQGSASGPMGPEAGHVTRREVAEALGMSPTQYDRAKRVVTTAENAAAPAAVREVAQVAVHEMDAGKLSIRAAEAKVKAATVAVELDGSPASAVVRKPPQYGPRRKHAEKLSAIATGLTGYLVVINEITELDQSIGNEEAARLRGGFSKAIAGLNRINGLLMERSK